MLLSSAYRANRSPRRSNSRSNSSRTMLLSKGDRGPPCGVPSSTVLNQPVFQYSSLQKRPDQLQQPLVVDPLGDSSHQSVVIDPIEKFLQVKVHHESIAFGDVLLRLFHRLMRRASGSKPVAVLGKRPVPSALQNLHYRLLDKTVQHRRDAKLSHPAVRLGDLHSSDRLRRIGSAQQLFPNGWPVLLQVSRKFVNGHSIHAGASLIRLDSCQCLLAVLPLA